VFTATSGSTTITQTASATFVCVSGGIAPLSGSQDLKFCLLTTPASTAAWSASRSPGPAAAAASSSASTSARPDLERNGNSSPLTINNGWTAGDRGINAGANKTLQLNFNFPLSGTGQYQLSTQWDNTTGGSLCTAPTILVNH
jgi:hypothetical protein